MFFFFLFFISVLLKKYSNIIWSSLLSLSKNNNKNKLYTQYLLFFLILTQLIFIRINYNPYIFYKAMLLTNSSFCFSSSIKKIDFCSHSSKKMKEKNYILPLYRIVYTNFIPQLYLSFPVIFLENDSSIKQSISVLSYLEFLFT